MSVRRISVMLAGWLVGSALLSGPAWSTSLFRCLAEGDQIVYTDTPSQLDQCAPITTSGAVTSLATTSSAHSMPGPSVETLPSQPAAPPPQPAPSPDGSTTVFAGSPASAATEPLPCPVGINPLNPFTNPPCPQ